MLTASDSSLLLAAAPVAFGMGGTITPSCWGCIGGDIVGDDVDARDRSLSFLAMDKSSTRSSSSSAPASFSGGGGGGGDTGSTCMAD